MASRAAKNRLATRGKKGVAGWLSVLFVVLIVMACGSFAAAAVAASWLEDLPDYTRADAFNTSMPTIVYASDGTTELARFQLEYRVPITREEVSQVLIDATISIEDARYYEHTGVDPFGIARALFNNLVGGQLEGASTITQQFVRNTILADEMGDISLKRKLREAFIATELEKMYSKDEILVMYLNTINYGAGAYGIEAASIRYFSKHASELTLEEAALLAGIPQSPTLNDPFLYPSNALARRNMVLERMYTYGHISQEEYEAAVKKPLELNPTEITDDGIIAYPYFTSYVRYLLYNDYDLSEADILKGGLKVYTTLDIEKQEAAEEAVADKRDSMGGNMEVAMAVVEPDTGYVQAIVGGSDYSESQVNLATGHGGGGRPCGSVFKTFTLVTAIKKGIDPYATYVDCTSPATVDGYTLENYANTNYGTKTIAGAFAVSSNTGFVRVISSIGVEDVAQTAHDLGVTTDLYEDEAGATLTLGVQNITPLELAHAVSTIANGGTRYELCAITRIEDREGNVIVDDSDPSKRATRVLTPEEAHAALMVMEDVMTSGTAAGMGLYSGQPSAGKTGTSEDYKDITFVGATPQLAVAVWIGDPTNEESVPTGTAADVFHNYATVVLEDEPIVDFEWADDPPYEDYEDRDYHVTHYYEDWRSKEDIKAEEAEKLIEKFKPGDLREDDLERLYDPLEVRVTYEYSDEYEEGVVLEQRVDVKKHIVYVVVSKGKSPEAKKAEEEKAAAEKEAAEKKAAEERAAAEKEAAEKAAAEKAAAEKAAAEKAAAEKAEADRKAAEEKAAAEKAAAEQAAAGKDKSG